MWISNFQIVPKAVGWQNLLGSTKIRKNCFHQVFGKKKCLLLKLAKYLLTKNCWLHEVWFMFPVRSAGWCYIIWYIVSCIRLYIDWHLIKIWPIQGLYQQPAVDWVMAGHWSSIGRYSTLTDVCQGVLVMVVNIIDWLDLRLIDIEPKVCQQLSANISIVYSVNFKLLMHGPSVKV